MRTVALLAIAAAATMSLSVHAEIAPKGHSAGSPTRHGNYCWIDTDPLGHGWWDRCDTSRQEGIAQHMSYPIYDNGGGGGGGGGGAR
jgi:hypothetical protein